MKKLLLLLLSLVYLFSITSCEKDPFLSVSADSITVPAKGNTTEVVVRSNVPWSVKGTEWCAVYPSSGEGGEVSVKITVKENNTYDARKYTLTFAAMDLTQTVSVSQESNQGTVVPQNLFELSSDAQQISVEVKANVDYDVLTDVDWIRQSGTKALESAIYIFDIDKNTDYDSREGKIIIKDKNGLNEEVVIVRQAHRDAIILSSKEYSISSESQSLEVKLQTNVDLEVVIPDTCKKWVSYTATKVLEDKNIVLDIAANDGYDSRSCEVVIKQRGSNLSDTVKILQSQKDVIISSQKEYKLSSEAQSLEVKLQANVEVNVVILDDAKSWISHVETKALDDRIVLLGIKSNDGIESRRGGVILQKSDGSLADTLLIFQSSRYVVPVGTTDTLEFKDNVFHYGKDMSDYISIVDDETLFISSNYTLGEIPGEGDIVYYDSGENILNRLFIGKVISVSNNGNGYLLHSELPSVDEVFKDFHLSVQMDSQNTTVIMDEVPEGSGVGHCEIVENSVWDNIETVYYEESPKKVYVAGKSGIIPINDVTLKFPITHKYFKGNIYVQLNGLLDMYNMSNYSMDVNVRVGVEGSYAVENEELNGGIDVNLIPVPGVTLCSYGVLRLRFVPGFHFYANGGIKVEAGLKYEMLNKDIKAKCSNNHFSGSAIEQLHDNYFRVFNLNLQGEMGFYLRGSLYAFMFKEEFLSAGVDTKFGIGARAEGNVGIQFPDIASFGLSIGMVPFGSLTPFVSTKVSGQLEKKKGQTIVIEGAGFQVPFLPDIHAKNYERRLEQYKLQVNAEIENRGKSFIETKEEGMALFEKGEEEPVKILPVQNSSAPIIFDIKEGTEYEIAPYVKSNKGKVVYGERERIEESLRDQLIQFYHDAGGDSWVNKTNWCSDKPIHEWYGISYEKDSDLFKIDLSRNNLRGNGTLKSPKIKIIYLNNNNLSQLDVSNCTSLKEIGCKNNNLRSLNISGCNSVEMIRCSDNELAKLDLSGCKSLEVISCENNKLEDLNLSECNSLVSILCERNNFKKLDLSSKVKLEGFSYVEGNLESLNLSGCSSLMYLDCFKNKLSELNLSGCDSLRLLDCSDNKLTRLDLVGKQKLFCVNCANNRLASLDFAGASILSSVTCPNNELVSLNFSGCDSLEAIWCEDNKLSTLDLSGCSLLNVLTCNKNELRSLNLSGCNSLTNIYCHENQLKVLDMTDCNLIEIIRCDYNELKALDLSGKKFLRVLNCPYNQLISLNLSGCDVLESVWCSCNELTSLDLSGKALLTSVSCAENKLTSLDLSGKALLTFVSCAKNKLTSLNIDGCNSIEELYCRENELKALDLMGKKFLKNLDCSINHLEALDLSGCDALEDVFCSSNELISLDLSGKRLLTYVSCVNNKLTSLNIDGCNSLEALYCSCNMLTQEITESYEKITNFGYDQRYLYGDKYSNKGYIDFGKGWWYPGEPEKGYHGK